MVEVLIGGIITLVVSWIFYVRAARGLEREAARLRQHTNLILRGMHNAGLAEVRWNEHGEPEGLVIYLSGVAASRSSASATGILTGGNEENEDDKDAPGDQG